MASRLLKVIYWGHKSKKLISIDLYFCKRPRSKHLGMYALATLSYTFYGRFFPKADDTATFELPVYMGQNNEVVVNAH